VEYVTIHNQSGIHIILYMYAREIPGNFKKGSTEIRRKDPDL